MRTTAKREIVIEAINQVNMNHGYQLELNRDEQVSSKWYSFTLKSKSGIPGSRTSWTGRRLPCASWHAHGYVMDKIFELEPEAVIVSLGQKYYKGFRWEDKNIGSVMQPCYFSHTSIL